MARWTEDEWWDDRDEPAFEPIHGPRRGTEEPEDEPDERAEPVSMQVELEGSVYRIPTALWWFTAPNRRDRPGVCVRCDLPARVAVLCPGRDPDSVWSRTAAVVLVSPTTDNGLTKTTAFALTPWPVDIRMLQLIHNDGERLGRLEGQVYAQIRGHIDWLESLYPEARQ